MVFSAPAHRSDALWLSQYCENCGHVVEVQGDWARQFIACPCCEAQLRLPSPEDPTLYTRACRGCGAQVTFSGQAEFKELSCPECRGVVAGPRVKTGKHKGKKSKHSIPEPPNPQVAPHKAPPPRHHQAQHADVDPAVAALFGHGGASQEQAGGQTDEDPFADPLISQPAEMQYPTPLGEVGQDPFATLAAAPPVVPPAPAPIRPQHAPVMQVPPAPAPEPKPVFRRRKRRKSLLRKIRLTRIRVQRAKQEKVRRDERRALEEAARITAVAEAFLRGEPAGLAHLPPVAPAAAVPPQRGAVVPAHAVTVLFRQEHHPAPVAHDPYYVPVLVTPGRPTLSTGVSLPFETVPRRRSKFARKMSERLSEAWIDILSAVDNALGMFAKPAPHPPAPPPFYPSPLASPRPSAPAVLPPVPPPVPLYAQPPAAAPAVETPSPSAVSEEEGEAAVFVPEADPSASPEIGQDAPPMQGVPGAGDVGGGEQVLAVGQLSVGPSARLPRTDDDAPPVRHIPWGKIFKVAAGVAVLGTAAFLVYWIPASKKKQELAAAGFRDYGDLKLYRQACGLLAQSRAEEAVQLLEPRGDVDGADPALVGFLWQLKSAAKREDITPQQIARLVAASPEGAAHAAKALVWEAAWRGTAAERLDAAEELVRQLGGSSASGLLVYLDKAMDTSPAKTLGSRGDGLDEFEWDARAARWHRIRVRRGDENSRNTLREWIKKGGDDRPRQEAACIALLEAGDEDARKPALALFADLAEAITFRVEMAQKLGGPAQSGPMGPRLRAWATADLAATAAKTHRLLYAMGEQDGMRRLLDSSRTDALYGELAAASISEIVAALGEDSGKSLESAHAYWTAYLDKLKGDQAGGGEENAVFQNIAKRVLRVIELRHSLIRESTKGPELAEQLAAASDFEKLRMAFEMGEAGLDTPMKMLAALATGAPNAPPARADERAKALDIIVRRGTESVRPALVRLLTHADASVRYRAAVRLAQLEKTQP